MVLSFSCFALTACLAETQDASQLTRSREPIPAQHKEWPRQVAAHVGSIRPDRHGPQRNDPAEGIPRHAYSPFDERNNRDHPCPPGGCNYEPDVVLVKLNAEVKLHARGLTAGWTDSTALNQKLESLGASEWDPVFPRLLGDVPGLSLAATESTLVAGLGKWHRVRFAQAIDAEIVAAGLREDPSVEYAEPEYLRKLAEGFTDPVDSPVLDHASAGPDRPPLGVLPDASTDPLYADQWHLDAVHAPEAWAYLQGIGLPPGGDRDIVVAVIDTGVDYTHPDLAANMWVNSPEFLGFPGVDDDANGVIDDIHGCNVVSNQHSGDPMDDHAHGTHVAGIIAAEAGNGVGGVGVAYNVQIMAIKAAQYSGVLATTDIAEAIYYAVEKGADVINMSFGGYSRSQLEEDALAVAFGQAVLVAAAGNHGKINLPCPNGRDMYPAAYNWVLGVMASGPGGAPAAFSNSDCTPHDTHEYEVLAPGVDVWSTLPPGDYAAWDGTSMAAPVVSGMAALARTKWPDKDIYSSRFIMGQIASNAAPVVDALASLTVAPKPELRYLEHWLFDTADQSPGNDDDGIVDAGETIDLAIVIRNHWGKADQVTVTLEPWAAGASQPDPYVTMITDTVDYGAVGSFNWDDNGLVYDDEGVITGVRSPFRFSASPQTPNDHLIPFRLTMACKNGLDPSDEHEYSTVSGFSLMVQRGRELPRIISHDTTLTSDYLWIVSQPTLIEGVTVRVEPGTQLQWGAPQPQDPYSTPSTPYIDVSGYLIAEGTHEDPVEFFPSPLVPQARHALLQTGNSELRYVRMRNAALVPYGEGGRAHAIDHCYFDGETSVNIAARYVSNTIVNRIQNMEAALLGDQVQTCLIDGARLANDRIIFGGHRCGPITDTVFLQDNFENRAVTLRLMSRADSEEKARRTTQNTHNAFLSKYWDPHVDHWMWIEPNLGYDRREFFGIVSNFWGTTSERLIEASIWDFDDDLNRARVVYDPILETASESTYPFVAGVALSNGLGHEAGVFGAETVRFTVEFNRDMDVSIQPQVSFGPDTPATDYTVHRIGGGWQSARRWVGSFDVNPVTGDGYQLIRIARAVAADDPWLVTGNDAGRFRFEIITSGTEAMNLQATGGEGYVDVSWTQDDFDLLAGFNVYRATSAEGNYDRLNAGLIPQSEREFRDGNVEPGRPYYYKFKVVKTDMTESDFSNMAAATPIDTIPPVIQHTPVTDAPPGLPLNIVADVTDNVRVAEVTLHFRKAGEPSFRSRAMTKTTGNRYSATIEGTVVASPGVDYYIEASDGVSHVLHGRPENTYRVNVIDRPVVTAVSPVRGPISGGTAVTIAGSNFKPGASVTFGGAAASGVTVVAESQIRCTTPPHFPETVDVRVANPDGQSGTLLRGFTYESDVASVSVPHTGGAQGALVQIPIQAGNIHGLAAASLTVTFDPAVLQGRGGRTGTLTGGWSIQTNATVPGQVRLSLASPGGTVSGEGTLALVECEVVGAPGGTTVLHPANVLLNDGAIVVSTADGSFGVNLVYDVSGTVRFWNAGRAVGGVLLTLEGDRVYTGLTGGTGAFVVSGAQEGDYVLSASKSDQATGITAYDASLVLQHDVGLVTLGGYQATAGDVNKSGASTSFDAYYILQKAVDLLVPPFPGAGVVWEFDPATRSYPNLASNLTGQDSTAVLLGDVSGSWGTGVGLQARPGAVDVGEPVLLGLARDAIHTDQRNAAVVLLRADETGLHSLDLLFVYDPPEAKVASVKAGLLAAGLALASNSTAPGILRVALAGAFPVLGENVLLDMAFESDETLELGIAAAAADEGQIRVSIEETLAAFDDDGDGIVNAFESRYGTDPARSDSDGDGEDDGLEVRAGTEPTDPTSVFRVVAIERVPGAGVTISWTSVPGRRYAVEAANAAAAPEWHTVGPEIAAAGEVATFADPEAGAVGGRLYRIRLVEDR